MATAVLDLDLSQLPSNLELPQHYTQMLILIRLCGDPVGYTLLPVNARYLSRDELHNALMESSGWDLWERMLHNYLKTDEFSHQNRPLPKATIAICTRDRTEDLQRCLDALMQLPDDGQEILVVDNCPMTEATRCLVENYDNVRYVRENRPGLNIARNRALREARHEIIVFTDDDTVTDPVWLRAILYNFDNPQVLCVTGLTMPLELETEAQEWSERYASFIRGFRRNIFDSSNLNPLAAAKVGAGANMALRKSVLEHVGFFDEALDAGTPTHSGGDTEMFSRIIAKGYKIVYEPKALSWHRHRRTWEELRKMIHGYGVGVYATWTRNLFFEGEFDVLRLAFGWFIYHQLPTLFRSLLRCPNSIPLDLIVAELRGCVAGPWAYLRSRRKLKLL